MATNLERMIEMLPYYLKDGDNIKKYYRAIAEMLGEAIDMFVEIQRSRDLDLSFGYGLDLIGTIIGESRQGLSDENYRNNLRTKIRRNRSYGDVEILNDFARSLLKDDFIGLFEDYNKSGELSLEYEFPRKNKDVNNPIELLKKIVAAGVNLKYTLNFYSNQDNYYGMAFRQIKHIVLKTKPINFNLSNISNYYGNSSHQNRHIKIKTEPINFSVSNINNYYGTPTKITRHVKITGGN